MHHYPSLYSPPYHHIHLSNYFPTTLVYYLFSILFLRLIYLVLIRLDIWYKGPRSSPKST